MALMAQQTETGSGAPRGAGVTGNRISARIAAVAPSATLAVDAKAKALQAQGESVIGFGAGEPDFPTPDTIVAAAEAACRDPRNHHYTPTAGLPELREAVAAKTLRDSGLEVAASQVLITNGGKQAVANAFAVLCDPGDEVLVPAPYWTTYPEVIALAGGVPVVIQTGVSSGFRVTVDQLEAARTPATKVLLFVSPSNPTGAVYPREEIEAIGRWAAGHGIWVVTDEIYEHLVYDGVEHHSMPVVVPEIADRCIVVNGVAKTYAMTGWRVGWMLGPTDAIAAATNLQSHETSNVANVSQRAALAAVSGDLSAVAMMRAAFDRRRRTIHRMLNEIDGVECLLPEGAFYAYPSVSGLYGRELAGRTCSSSAELAELAIEVAKVAVVPGEAFGTPGYFRMSYALGDDDLVEGVRRLATLFAGG
jgi:aspartate/methionine/tyrosine aminotransferase